MVMDLSYLAEQPSEEQEKAIRSAVAEQCLTAIATYLTEVADTMDANNIAGLNSETLRAMADQFTNRLNNDENEEN